MAARFLLLGVIVALVAALQKWTGYNNRIEWEELGLATFWIMMLVMFIELGVRAGRVFSEEVHWRTWSSLAMLPVSLPRVAYSKAAANFVLGILPGLCYAIFGLVLCRDAVADVLHDLAREPETWWLIILPTVLVILFMHMTTYVSLWVRFGAFPLTVVLFLVSGFLFLMAIQVVGLLFWGISGRTAELLAHLLAFTLTVTGLTLSGLLHPLIGGAAASIGRAVSSATIGCVQIQAQSAPAAKTPYHASEESVA